MKNKRLIYGIFTASVFITFLLDFLTKKWAISESFKAIKIIPNFFYTTPFQTNDGIAFGIDVPKLLPICSSILILYLLFRIGLEEIMKKSRLIKLKSILLGMVIGGGLGNLWERIVNGYVVDFIVLGPIPVFNIADVGITVGLVALFATMFLSEK